MLPLASILATLTLAVDPQPQPVPDAPVRQTVQRSLAFLEQAGVNLMNENKCSSCHHVPMTLWSHHEARQRGFAVNQQAIDQLTGQALAPYLRNVNIKPNGKKEYVETKGELPHESVYIALGIGASPTIDEATKKGLEKLLVNFIAKQQDNGSWTVKDWVGPRKAPIYETDEVMTLWVLLALDNWAKAGLDRDAWIRSRDRALAWLKNTKQGNSTQALALRLVVQVKYGTPQDVEPLVKQLLSRQQTDGGWGWAPDRPSDGLGTGQALYALSWAGVASEEVVERARTFLIRSQQPDGSWKVGGRNPTYFGTAWAVIGLVRTLPE